jgi:hypothetical protein
MLIACVLILGRLSFQCPEILSYFCLQIWSKSILSIGLSSKPKYLISFHDSKPSDTNGHITVASDNELNDCVELYHLISTCVPLNPNVVNCLNENGVTEALFDLTIFIHLSAPLSTLRQLLVGICHEIIKYGDATHTVPIFDQIITFGWKQSYQLTDSGGIEIQLGGQQNQNQNFSTLANTTILTPFPSSSREDVHETDEDYMTILREALIQHQSLLIDPETESDSQYSLNAVQNIMERTRAICQLLNMSSSQDSEIIDEENPNTSSSQNLIPSKLFLRMLRGYLEISSTDSIEEVFVSSTPSHVCGIVVLVMKSHMSLDILLQDGEWIGGQTFSHLILSPRIPNFSPSWNIS